MDKHRHKIQAVAWVICWVFAFSLMEELNLSIQTAFLIFAPGWLPMWNRIVGLADKADKESSNDQ